MEELKEVEEMETVENEEVTDVAPVDNEIEVVDNNSGSKAGLAIGAAVGTLAIVGAIHIGKKYVVPGAKKVFGKLKGLKRTNYDVDLEEEEIEFLPEDFDDTEAK